MKGNGGIIGPPMNDLALMILLQKKGKHQFSIQPNCYRSLIEITCKQ